MAVGLNLFQYCVSTPLFVIDILGLNPHEPQMIPQIDSSPDPYKHIPEEDNTEENTKWLTSRLPTSSEKNCKLKPQSGTHIESVSKNPGLDFDDSIMNKNLPCKDGYSKFCITAEYTLPPAAVGIPTGPLDPPGTIVDKAFSLTFKEQNCICAKCVGCSSIGSCKKRQYIVSKPTSMIGAGGPVTVWMTVTYDYCGSLLDHTDHNKEAIYGPPADSN